MDESALRRPIGSRDLMNTQLQRLLAISQHDRTSLFLLPLAVGAHPGMRGPFILLEFEDPAFDDVLFMENPRGDYLTRDDPDSTAEYFELFDQLERLSLGGEEFDHFIRNLVEGREAP